ncbi:MAG: hypothetical protein IJA44_04140 [Clostridia bacterium]|nr:hypothetical protein [Clostridia bacterium]
MQENDQELLQKAHILIDLKKRYIDEIKRYGIATALAFIFLGFFIAIASDRTIQLEVVIISSVFFVLLCVLMSALLIYNIYKYYSATKNFNIEIDRLTNKENIYRVRNRHINNYKYLYFSHGRRFQVIPILSFTPHKGVFYSWSKLNQMNEIEIFNCSGIDDQFYLITHNDKIVYIYNTKIFKLSAELENLLNK